MSAERLLWIVSGIAMVVVGLIMLLCHWEGFLKP